MPFIIYSLKNLGVDRFFVFLNELDKSRKENYETMLSRLRAFLNLFLKKQQRGHDVSIL